MPKKPLLLLPAKRRMWTRPGESVWAGVLRLVATAAGMAVVLVGLADVTSRLAHAALGNEALFAAFAPAAAIRPVAPAPAAPKPANATPTPLAPAAATSSVSVLVPARIKVPSLGIDAKVVEVGKKADNSMGTPKDFMDIGWWSLGARPGEPGNAVFDGHINNALTKAGVFEHLSQIRKGDYITVADAEGHALVYKVAEVKLYDTSASTEGIFSKTGPSQIILITCDGEWVQDEHQFNKRLVVVARPAQ